MSLPRLLISTAAVASLVVGAALRAADMPPRKPGRWEVKAASSRGGAQTMLPCVDALTDAQFQDLGKRIGEEACSQTDLRQEGGKLVTDAVCRLGGTTVMSYSEASGSFESNYRLVTDADYRPPLMGIREADTTIEARWLGPCDPDPQPGV